MVWAEGQKQLVQCCADALTTTSDRRCLNGAGGQRGHGQTLAEKGPHALRPEWTLGVIQGK